MKSTNYFLLVFIPLSRHNELPLRSVLRLLQRHGRRYYPHHIGWSQVFVMQPFEIIKVRLQTQSIDNPQYKGIGDCLGKIIKN